jgi:hypothetical protein
LQADLHVPGFHQLLLNLAYARSDGQAQTREIEWLESHQSEAIALLEQANNAAVFGHLKDAAEMFRQRAKSTRLHASDTGPTPQEIETDAASASALLGKCAPAGTPPPSLVMAL